MADEEFHEFLKRVTESSDTLSLKEMEMAVEAMHAYLKYKELRIQLERW